MTDLAQKTLRLARDAAQVSVDAAVTIAARSAQAATSGLDITGGKSREAKREANLMVQEKVVAAMEGVAAAQLAFGAFWMRAATGRILYPDQFSGGMMDVVNAAFTPAKRKVRANAHRLTGLKRIGRTTGK